LEFTQNGKVKRKWAPKRDIILLTDDATFFKKKVQELSAIEEEHTQKIEAIEQELNQEFDTFAKDMNNYFEKFEEEKKQNKNLPCLLNKY